MRCYTNEGQLYRLLTSASITGTLLIYGIQAQLKVDPGDLNLYCTICTVPDIRQPSITLMGVLLKASSKNTLSALVDQVYWQVKMEQALAKTRTYQGMLLALIARI